MKTSFQRILVVRTDRIGDVLLSTPVIKALRDKFPRAHIAVMVGPYAREIVEGNPYLNEVIVYDKDARQKGWWASLRFARALKAKKFDLALVLHPTNRAHLLAFFAGIPKRVGYDRKLGFLLTDRLEHTKQRGEKHELEYNLDLVRYLGIEPQDAATFMPVTPEAEKWAESFLRQEGVADADGLAALHPGASCISKLWPVERFAEVADRLVDKYGFKILLVAGPKDAALAAKVAEGMRHRPVNLAGKTSLSRLAGIFKRCRVLISNDSGPVHLAAAVGIPVISIFGRNQKGLSPKRWGPANQKSRVLHKAGCLECLAHNCKNKFACIMAISVEEVLSAAESVLNDK